MPKREIPKFEFRPDSDQSIHRIEYKGTTIYLERIRSSTPLMGADSKVPFTPEHMVLTCWGSKMEVLKDLVNEAVEATFAIKAGNSINIYTQC